MGPWLQTTIHPIMGGRRRNKYSRYMDGLHLSPHIKAKLVGFLSPKNGHDRSFCDRSVRFGTGVLCRVLFHFRMGDISNFYFVGHF